MAEINWDKVRKQAVRLSDVEQLKKELSKLRAEITKFDIHAHLNPVAKKKLRDLEKRYAQIMRRLSQAQRQLDRELSKGLKVIQKTKADSEKQLKVIKNAVQQQGAIFERAARDLKKRVSKKKATKKKKAASKKKTTKKTTKKVTKKKTASKATARKKKTSK